MLLEFYPKERGCGASELALAIRLPLPSTPATCCALSPDLERPPRSGLAQAHLWRSRPATFCTCFSHGPCRGWSEWSPEDSAKFYVLILLAGRRFTCPWLSLRDVEEQSLPHSHGRAVKRW